MARVTAVAPVSPVTVMMPVTCLIYGHAVLVVHVAVMLMVGFGANGIGIGIVADVAVSVLVLIMRAHRVDLPSTCVYVATEKYTPRGYIPGVDQQRRRRRIAAFVPAWRSRAAQRPARLLAATCSPLNGSNDSTSTSRSSMAAIRSASTAQFADTVGPSTTRTWCAVGPGANGTPPVISRPAGSRNTSSDSAFVTQNCVEVEVEFGCPRLELIACQWLPAPAQGEQRASV